jgi:hypothetical protein
VSVNEDGKVGNIFTEKEREKLYLRERVYDHVRKSYLKELQKNAYIVRVNPKSQISHPSLSISISPTPSHPHPAATTIH